MRRPSSWPGGLLTCQGWIALLGRDPEDDDAPAEVFSFCPVCAAREFEMTGKLALTYT